MSLWLAVAVAAASFVGTRLALGYARRHNLLDHPTERSSHHVATPRGGGVAIALAALGGIAAAGALGLVPRAIALTLTGGGALVAAVGWIDDRRGIGPVPRLLAHAAAAAWAVWLVGPLDGAGAAGTLLGVFGIMGATNLYNFMDGIDGLAASEGVSAGAAMAALLAAGGAPGLALTAAIVAAAAGGFLPWNWPPARIFMGDVGSGLLGFLFGTLALAAHNEGALPLAFALVLFGVFVFDATITLVRRALAGEPVASAHRTHAYQRLVQAGWPHRRVTVAAVVANVALAGIAWLDWRSGGSGLRALAVALGVLAGLYVAVERAAPAKRFARR
jgi:Fuc2NAc and GlcNAc transferase